MHTMTPPPLPATLRTGWWARHWRWFVPLLALGLLGLGAGLILLLFSGISRMMTSSHPYQHALQTAQENPAVIAALGAPIDDGWMPMGNIATSGSSGKADMKIAISGPKGEGDIYLEAEKSAGAWTYSILVVHIDGRDEAIDLLVR